jgi:RHH-type proline utilization regulon transcriptional repressor/proline dehydrogenase/delta 1-pyrroline-5-carboxylate dehydrogenase
MLERAAGLLESRRGRFMALMAIEGGKTLDDSVSELREAVDFLRYYAGEARKSFGEGEMLPGPTGESNMLRRRGRGVFVAISPWNFPLAIFLGQIAAALAAGNAVVAKPAEQTPLIAAEAVRLLHEAGVPGTALHFVPGAGDVGARLVAHEAVAGVVFTGSTEVAWAINRSLAQKRGPIVPLIAETGGINAMIVDATALPEQCGPKVFGVAAAGGAGGCGGQDIRHAGRGRCRGEAGRSARGVDPCRPGDRCGRKTAAGGVYRGDEDPGAGALCRAGAGARVFRGAAYF